MMATQEVVGVRTARLARNSGCGVMVHMMGKERSKERRECQTTS